MDNNRLLVPLVGILALVAVGFVFKAAQGVILPLIVAWLLSYLLAPVVNFLVRHRIHVGLAVFVVLMLVLGFFYLAGAFIFARITDFVGEYPKYQAQLNDIAADISTNLNLPPEITQTFDWVNLINPQKMLALSGSFFSFMGNVVLILIFLVFMLLGKPYFKLKIEHAFPGERSAKITDVIGSISKQIGSYLSIKIVISMITGILVWLICTVMGIDFPVTWGLIAFFLNFIPNIGSIIATVPPVLIAVVQFYPTYWQAMVALILMLAVQQTMGSFIEPKIMGENLNLSPVVILLSLVFWGWLWGITGALLSVPIAAAIKIVCENIAMLHPIGAMMGSGKYYAKAVENKSKAS